MISVDRFLNALEDLRSAAIQVEREVEEAAAAAAPTHGTQPISIDTEADGDGVFDTSSGRMVIASGDVEAWAWAARGYDSGYAKGYRGPWSMSWGGFAGNRITEAPKSKGQPFFFSNNNGEWEIEIIWTRVNGIWSQPFIMPPVGGFNSDGT